MLKNLFGRAKTLSPQQYQRHVLSLLRLKLTDEHFEPTDNPLVIRLGEWELGLQNLYASYIRDHPSGRLRDDNIQEHFTRLVQQLRLENELREMSWKEIRHLLRPQFMPREYAERSPLLTFPFTDDLLIGLVTDWTKTYSYVRIQDQQRWGQIPTAVYDAAIANLDAASAEIEMHFCEGPDRWLGIEVKDGYDAARLLLPTIRTNAVDRLDSPCFAVIPNRDFLFFWAIDNSLQFHTFARERTERDHAAQPYPLTDTVFKVTSEEIAVRADTKRVK